MTFLELDALRELLREHGWESLQEGPPYETWVTRSAMIAVCAEPPRTGHVYFTDERSTTLVLTIDHARTLLEPHKQ